MRNEQGSSGGEWRRTFPGNENGKQAPRRWNNATGYHLRTHICCCRPWVQVTDENLSPIQVLNAAISRAVEEAVMRQNGDSTNRVDSEDANDELLEAPASCAIH